MAIVRIAVRNQNGNALTSIEGIPFIVILSQDERMINEQVVDLIYADAYWEGLIPGEYIAMVRHQLVEPPLARYNFEIITDSELLSILYNYLEPERVLLNIRTNLVQQ